MDIQDLTITQSDGTVTTLKPKAWQRKDINMRVPDNGKRFVQILHDPDVLGHPRQFEEGQTARYPFPAVVNTKWGLITRYNDKIYDYLPLEDRWQWFMWDLWDWASGYQLPKGEIESFYTKTTNSGTFANVTPGSLMWVYVNMIEKSRSHTDSAAPEVGARDVVTDRNLTNPKPYEWLCRPTTGQLAAVKADLGTKLVLEAIDLLGPVPTMKELESKPWLYGWATQIHIDGTVSRYPQIKEAFEIHGIPPAGTPIPLFSLGGSIVVDKKATRELPAGVPWSPYVPGI